MRGGGRTMTDLAATLSNSLGDRLVIDKTVLTGTFDFELRWMPERMQAAVPDPATVTTTDAPSIFVAVQEQLGLKLESQKAPIEFLIIDSVERPTPN
jgi:uncharacterized protein (TIGR03435 family)